MKILLETEHVDANCNDSNGEIPLHAAIQHGHEAVVKLLLETGRGDADSKFACFFMEDHMIEGLGCRIISK